MSIFEIKKGTTNHVTQAQVAAAATVTLGIACLSLTIFALRARQNNLNDRPDDSAPSWLSHNGKTPAGHAVAGKTVLINRSRSDLFSCWSDFTNLPRFMENIESVEVDGERSIWTISAPAGQKVRVETEITETRDNELLAWKSTENSQIETSGHIRFSDAPAGRGTYVEAIIEYRPPAGRIGRAAAHLLRREPGIQARHELKRFKMLMETGEIATSQRTQAND